MKRWTFATVVVALLVSGFLLTVPRTSVAGSDPSERQAAYQWFDTLGYPDLKTLPFVRVTEGESRATNDGGHIPVVVDAWLISDSGERFTVIHGDLSTGTHVRENEPEPHIDFVRANLKGYAAIWIAEQQKLEKTTNSYQFYGESLSKRGRAFVLSRACAAAGYDADAVLLYDYAASQPILDFGEQTPANFREALSQDIADVTIKRADLDLVEPQISREQLLATYRSFIKNFPKSWQIEYAKETAALLEKMVAEDRDQAKKGPKDPARLAVPEKVKLLIFQLRDQNGSQMSNPGSCDFFNDPRGEASPASQLVKIGLDAVPQLIDAMDDPRFTRSKDVWKGVLRVGDAALAIIERIAGRRFYQPNDGNAHVEKDVRVAAVKNEVKAWWAQVSVKGLRKVIIESVERGDDDSASGAEYLVEKYPEDAVDAIRKGLDHAKSSEVRAGLITAMIPLHGDAANVVVRAS